MAQITALDNVIEVSIDTVIELLEDIRDDQSSVMGGVYECSPNTRGQISTECEADLLYDLCVPTLEESLSTNPII